MREKLFQWKLKRIEKRGERYKREYKVKEAYAKYIPERKKRKVSNILLVVVVAAIVIYTVANLWITYTTGVSIDSTLTTCFYAFWGSEILALTGIKLSKIKNNYDDMSCAEIEFVEDEDDEFEDEDVCG
jgi:hypothetical protein